MQKDATVTACLLESPVARFKKFRLEFYNYVLFASAEIKNGNIWLLLSSSFISSSMKGTKSSYSAENFPALVTC